MANRYVEDPKIAQVARIEHAAMAQELANRFAKGEEFFHARTQVLAANGPRIAKSYGKEVAERAMQALCSYGPEVIPAWAVEVRNRTVGDRAVAHMNEQFGPGHRLGAIATWSMRHHDAHRTLLTAGIGLACASPFLAFAGWLFGLPFIATTLWIFAGATLMAIASVALVPAATPRRYGPAMSYGYVTAHREAAFEARVAAADAAIEQEEQAAKRARELAAEQRSNVATLRTVASRMERSKRSGRR